MTNFDNLKSIFQNLIHWIMESKENSCVYIYIKYVDTYTYILYRSNKYTFEKDIYKQF